MAHKHLSTYLIDHLAGSAGGVELLANLAAAYKGTEIEPVAIELKAEVAADRAELEALMDRLNIKRSVPREASAWIAEKLTQLKLRFDDPKTGALRLLESTDAISIGVEGKRLLWLALSTAAQVEPALQGTDYQRLIQRAESQRRRIEDLREGAAKTVLTVGE